MSRTSIITEQLTESSEVKKMMISFCANQISKAADLCIDAIKSGRKILWCGNGGSAADAQHLSTELLGGLRNHDREPFASIALTTDTSFLTAWTNDTDFLTVFSRQIEALGKKGDVLIAISTSGHSKNVIEATKTAHQLEMRVITFTGGSGGHLKELGDNNINIPSEDTQRIQEGHITAGHILCEIIEHELSV